MTNRKARVTELIQRELSSILARDHAFPDVLVTVSDVDLTPDFKHAHIFIGVIGPAHKQQAVVDKLNSMRGVLSSRVAKRVILRNTPHFHFKLDHSVERGVRVTALMEEIDKQLAESALLNPAPDPDSAGTDSGRAADEPPATDGFSGASDVPSAPPPGAPAESRHQGQDQDDEEEEEEDSGSDSGDGPQRPLRRRNR